MRASPGGDQSQIVIPGREVKRSETGIHNHSPGLWIPGLRQEAHPGMTSLLSPRTRYAPAASAGRATGFSTIGRLISAEATAKPTDSHQTMS